MKLHRQLLLVLAMGASLAGDLRAVIFVESGDPTFHAKTPGDNSGWQYEGKYGYFMGVPIGPYHFITAKHFPIGDTIYTKFDFHGDLYTVFSVQESTTADLRIVKVVDSKPFPTWAPIYMEASEVGSTMTLMGRGTLRGSAVIVSDETKGWLWGSPGNAPHWGRNVVEGIDDYGAGLGEMLRCHFDSPGIASECTVSTGDSGGGWFRLGSDGQWRLAGVTYAAEASFRYTAGGSTINAAIYDKGGLYYYNGTSWVLEPNTGTNKPSEFIASRIATATTVTWIKSIVGATYIDNLAQENFAAWQHLYFTPAEIATPATTGLLADYDKDGIGNLLEFALNLDPTFNERAVMTPATGFRGLPLVRIESVSGVNRLTIEFVRRKSTSGAALTYTPQFSDDLTTWTTSILGTETVTSLNDRWERVKVVDASTVEGTPKHFGRLKVEQ